MTAPVLLPISALLLGAIVVRLGRLRWQGPALVVFPLAALGLVSAALEAHAAPAGWWSIDPLGVLLGTVALVIGCCATRYAVRQFAGEVRSRPIVAASLLVVASVVALDLASTLGALAISWSATSAATLLLLRAGSPSWRSAVVRRALLTFVAVDGLLLLALVVPALAGGGVGVLGANGRISIVAGTALLAASCLAAAGRAGFGGRRSWVVGTVATPTSISALLHAGVVNAGAVLLVRVESLTGAPRWPVLVLGVGCMILLVARVPMIRARADLKGQLAISTVSQMAFMLLAVALGWPLLALTHLVGHGLYKAGRFMAAGGAIEERARRRRSAPAGRVLADATRVLGAVGLLATSMALGSSLGRGSLAALAVIGPGVTALWWERTRVPVRGAGAGWLVLGSAIVAYGATVALGERLLGPSIVIDGWQAPWWSLAACLGGVVVLTGRHRATERPSATSSLPASAPERAVPRVEVAA